MRGKGRPDSPPPPPCPGLWSLQVWSASASLVISVSLFLALSRSLCLCRHVFFSVHFQDSRRPGARAGCRDLAGRGICNVSLQPPPHSTHPLRSSDPRLGRHTGQAGRGGRAGGGVVPGACQDSPGPGCVFSLPQRRKRLREGKCVVKVTWRGSGSRDSNPHPSDPRES